MRALAIRDSRIRLPNSCWDCGGRFVVRVTDASSVWRVAALRVRWTLEGRPGAVNQDGRFTETRFSQFSYSEVAHPAAAS